MQIKQPLVVDVAYNNEGINWPVAKAGGVRAAIAKASEGRAVVGGFEDSEFKNNWQQMRDAGLPRGAYHFYRWYASSGSQAKKFVSVLKKYGGVASGDRLALDEEEQGHMSFRNIIDFSYNVEQETGILPLCYSWAWMLNEMKMNKLSSSDVEFLMRILVWGAGYPDNPDLYVSVPKFYQADPAKFGKTIMWQYHSEVPGIQGIPGGTDVNWIDPEFLAAWERETFGGSPPTPPQPAPTPVPPSPSGQMGVVTAHPYLRVRSGPGTIYPISYGDHLLPGQNVMVYETKNDDKGNLWGRIGDGRWVAINYEGQVYVQRK